ncbi:MAG: hypothetical protein A2W19_05775 [Spirochaetes bacterium RBG_16_49_21]|nr:MAG: hypothetical protein A2W19_05775 [Spirochaetes bacterium RBG_16_49_21]
MKKTYSQIFEMESGILCYDGDKSILLCKAPDGTGKRWVKKIHDINLIETVTEDARQYYLSCEAGEIEGFFIAINKDTGATAWFIPGKAYFQILYGDCLYAIFADERKIFYLIKIERADGRKVWHRQIDEDLCEYSFRSDRILLTYESGKIEKISPLSGAVM